MPSLGLVLLAPLALLVSGCAAQGEPPARAPSADPGALDGAIARYEPSPGPGARSATLERPPLDEPRTIAPEPRPARRRSGRVIDVKLHDASLESALFLLAAESRVDLVVAGKLQGTVSADLHRVDPREALFALASAHGVALEEQGRILIARGH